MNYLPAFEVLDQRIVSDSDDDEAYFLRGEYYFWQKDYSKAQNDYSKAIQINPEFSKAQIALGYVYSLFNDLDAAQSQFSQSKKLYTTQSDEVAWLQDLIKYTQYLLNGQESDDYYNERGMKLADLGLYLQAIKDYTKAVALNDNCEYSYYNRGLAYNDLAAYELAIPNFTKAIELNPDDAWNYNDRGNSYSELKQYELAIADYKTGLIKAPDNNTLYHNLANAYFDLENYDLAIHYFKEAIRKDPEDASYHVTLAEVYICAADYQAALNYLQQQQTLIQTSQYQIIDVILRLVLACIYGDNTEFLEEQLRHAQQQATDISWDFGNLMRWFEQNQQLTETTLTKVKKYLDIALHIS